MEFPTDKELKQEQDQQRNDIARLREAVKKLQAIHGQVEWINRFVNEFVDRRWGSTINAEGSRMAASKADFLHTLTLDLAWDLSEEIKHLEDTYGIKRD